MLAWTLAVSVKIKTCFFNFQLPSITYYFHFFKRSILREINVCIMFPQTGYNSSRVSLPTYLFSAFLHFTLITSHGCVIARTYGLNRQKSGDTAFTWLCVQKQNNLHVGFPDNIKLNWGHDLLSESEDWHQKRACKSRCWGPCFCCSTTGEWVEILLNTLIWSENYCLFLVDWLTFNLF